MRLGDLDALKKAIDDYAEKRQDTLLWQSDIEELIDNAPTVVVDNCGKCPYYKDRDRNIITEAYNDGYKTAKEDFENHKLVNNSQELVKEKSERPQGEWIGKEEYDDYPNKTVCECSECGKMICISHNDFPNFCENCGADMKGGAE